ncbi:unnamed protein product [Microthlaspi erraticum]|uniref:Uncharacterized protein n=1 Tax=Microthlaspi erraticum TaxID=1685480 RepID=A0A6D2HVZ5_9BRAS|nr:unnamed protein product [Microthlaspi erraticum]
MSIKASMKGNFSSSCLISSSNLALCASNSCFLNLPGKGRGGLYGGGPDGVSFFFATGLVGWLELALSVLSQLDRALVCLAESRFLSSIELWFRVLFQLDRVRVELSSDSTKSSPSSSSMSTAIWGGLPLLGNCRPLLSVTAWAYSCGEEDDALEDSMIWTLEVNDSVWSVSQPACCSFPENLWLALVGVVGAFPSYPNLDLVGYE